MNKKIKIFKIILDVFMTIVLILLMNKFVTGITIHEIIGIAILVVAILHNILNIKWIKAMSKNFFRKDVPVKSKILYIINFIAFVILASDVVIGILISEALFPNIQVGNRSLLISWHKFLSYWLLIIISIHIGLHWDMVMNSFNLLLDHIKKNWKDSIVLKILLKLMYVGIAIAGIISLAKPDVHNNFLLQNNSSKQNNMPNTFNNTPNNSSTNSNSNTSTDSDSSDEKSTAITSVSSVTIDEVTSLQDYLGKLYCTGCGRHCPLTNPQCNKGEIRQEAEISNYNEMYKTDETYSSSGTSSSTSSNNNSTNSSSSSSSITNNNSSQTSKSNSSKGTKPTKPSSTTENSSSSDSSSSQNSASSSNGNIPMQKPNSDFGEHRFDTNSSNSESSNLMDYVWIMGFVVGSTYYVAKLPKIVNKKKEK